MKAPKSVCIVLVLILGFYTNAQEKIQDTLLHKSYDDLNTLFYYWLPKDTVTAKTIVNTYIAKARAEKDSIETANGYYYYATSFGAKRGLQYADTIIALTENIEDKYYPAVGYLLKGYWYFKTDNYRKALKYYLLGETFAVKRNNLQMQIHILSMVAVLKTHTGDYRGALDIEKKHLHALETQPKYREIVTNGPNLGNNFNTHHLVAIHNLSLTFLHLKENDSSRIYHQKGIAKSLEYKDTLKYYQIVSSSGSLEFYDGNFQAALDSLNKAIPHLTDDHNIAMAHYYKGRSYQALESHKDALLMFLKTDSLATKINYKFPELREAYEYLADYYDIKKERDSQLIYINKILDLDKELLRLRSMDGEIVRKYDTP
ncbi:hypothetical protein ED312_07715, partial [Sinomicrobium pectinilyticum]